MESNLVNTVAEVLRKVDGYFFDTENTFEDRVVFYGGILWLLFLGVVCQWAINV